MAPRRGRALEPPPPPPPPPPAADLGDPDRVRCAIFLLQDDAALWWEGVEKTVDPATLPWTEFKRLFFEKYFTADVRALLKTEFMSLRQGDLSVAQFVVNFKRVCHFVPLIGDNEEANLHHFIVGLRPAIRWGVLMAEPADYASALRRALRSEQRLRDISAEVQSQRPFSAHGQQQQQHDKKPYYGPPRQQGRQAHRPQGHQAQRPVPPNSREKPLCRECHHHHFGKCLMGAGVFFKCKKPGHVVAYCPDVRRPATGRVIVMQAKEADPDTTLITGLDILEFIGEIARPNYYDVTVVFTKRILVAGVATKTLLDSGATHSFISEAFVLKWGIQREELLVGFSVIIPSGEELTTKILVRSLELLLQGRTVVADLIVLPILEFDLILGMDWMVKNAVVIDF
ncbi:uncharacterized protein [Henckelia pumila]|uniref:uncharacterized protein n=1 Tax=Henckelia pumila TaxID=405737 RepID=UPI003C6DF6CA